MQNLIDRQAAIDAINKALDRETLLNSFVRKVAVDALKTMPSAQPEIIHCRECVYGEQDYDGWWYCRSFGCQVGDEDGSGFCSDAERKDNV